MKRNSVVLINIIIVIAMMLFVFLYTRSNNKAYVAQHTESFLNLSVAMEAVTANYLEGEQSICVSWANYINNSDLDLDGAMDYLRLALDNSSVSAQLIRLKDMTGRSTQPKLNNPSDDTVSYAALPLFDQGHDEAFAERALHLTRTYTNPMTGGQSIAFYVPVKLRGDEEALLLRVVPVRVFEKEWSFPTSEYKSAELSLVDAEGNYIIRSRSFKNNNFFEFYKSYNNTDYAQVQALEQALKDQNGTLVMRNSRDQECLIAYTPVNHTGGWSILAYVLMEEIGSDSTDWTMVGIIAAGLLILFAFDLAVMIHYNRQLAQAVEVADRASRAKTEFLSTMSHDIRTPMNAIIGLTAIAGKNIEDTQTVRESLRKIHLASNHLLTLINDILDISKVESGKLNLSPVTFSIVETTENLVNISQPMVKEKNIDFSFRVSGIRHEHLYADQLRLNQIYINILSNAVKYTQPGGKVSVDLSEELSERENCARLVYRVQDNGIGMTEAFMSKMYQAFSRETDSRVNTVQGTGLGLAITKQMVDLMGGTIECASKPGQGTTFVVTLDLPLADRLVENMMLQPVRVLIADDDELILSTAKETLASIGAEPETASSGQMAVDMAVKRHQSGHGYGVVILDWKMPDMDGIEAARRIRQSVGEDVPILLISAYDWSELEEEARAAGVSDFISKPLFRSTLYGKLNELLGAQAEHTDEADDHSDIAGMRILVAEDNDVNWEIISMLLSMQEIRPERAENGQIAVDRLREAGPGVYDLVFMDIQMPVMNGLDATRAIRRLEGPVSRIPIIAMTADAFSENVAACLEAGMNGHIAKPIDMKLVIKEIRRIKEERK